MKIETVVLEIVTCCSLAITASVSAIVLDRVVQGHDDESLPGGRQVPGYLPPSFYVSAAVNPI